MPNRFLIKINTLKERASDLRFIAILTIGYAVFNILNHWLTQSLYFETGAHLIHLPSGVRMVLVMVAGVVGSVVIFFASFIYSYWVLLENQFSLSAVTSLATSVIPLAVVYISRKCIHWKSDFSDMTTCKLLVISITYAVTNATVLQAIFYLFGQAAHPINAWLVMFTGDILGIVIVLYILRIIGKILKYRQFTD